MLNKVIGIFLLLFLFSWTSCTFDYGQNEGSESRLPDLVMSNVEYVRVRSAELQARFHAELAERYEKAQKMELTNFTFKQYTGHGDEVNAGGMAGSASYNMNSGNINMSGGVRLEMESEDIVIETERLEWLDEDRTLTSGKEDPVNIYRKNGTGFTGIGFYADARSRKWEFDGAVSGTYIYDDEDENEETTSDDIE